MTIDATKPDGTTHMVSDLDDYMKENRTQINALWSAIQDLVWSAVTSITSYEMTGGQTFLTGGTELASILIETVQLTADAAHNLEQIKNCRSGQIKIFIFGDTNVTVVHNDSYISLNGGTNLPAQANDVLCLINIGGNPGVDDGYWREIFRTLKA